MAGGFQIGGKAGQNDAPHPTQPGQTEHPGHLQQLRVCLPNALQRIGIQHREHHEKGNEGADAPAGQPQQRNDNKGGHRHRLNGQNIGPQQSLHPEEPGGQGRQNQGCQKCQEKTQADAAKSEAQSLPGGLFSQQPDHTPGHPNRPHQQQPVVDQRRCQLPDAKGQKGSKKLCCPSGWIKFRFTRHNRKRRPAERRPLRQGSARTAHSGSRPEHPSFRCR